MVHPLLAQDAIHTLMAGSPRGLDTSEVEARLRALPQVLIPPSSRRGSTSLSGSPPHTHTLLTVVHPLPPQVLDVHCFHAWTLAGDKHIQLV